MLTYLRIQDFALIRSMEMEPGAGLTVITGETGAGKSIILAAVGLLLGGRASAELIRQGSDAAVVEAAFAIDPKGPQARLLGESGLSNSERGELVMRRVVSRQGRNRVHINGSLATLGQLAELGPGLLSLCGQHSQQELLRPAEHLRLLDSYAGLEPARQDYTRVFDRVRELDKRLSLVEESLARRRAQRELLEHIVEEISSAGLEPGEQQRLNQERKLIANSEQMAKLARGAYEGLYGSEEGSALDLVGRIRGLLRDLARLDGRMEKIRSQVDEAFYQLEDAAGELRDYSEGLFFDPARLDQVESRLMLLQRLTRKYGGDEASALDELDRAQKRLDSLEQGGRERGEILAEREKRMRQAATEAEKLGRARREASGGLARAVALELSHLGLSDCRFRTDFSPPSGRLIKGEQGPLGRSGGEQAEFFIAPNPGEGFKALGQIASGGELSRILLALKGLNAKKRGAATQIFDEVDAGIGGAIGASVGRKLARLARSGQVICITHLPQIAAFGDRHYSVRKQTVEGRTLTSLQMMDAESSLDELARMLTGTETGGSAREHARQLMAAAQKGRA